MENTRNIWQTTKLTDLYALLNKHQTVIVGFTLATTPNKDKVAVRKFLKDKSGKFPLLVFVYMEVQPQSIGANDMISDNLNIYPLVYHVRNGKDILVKIENATFASLYESFAVVEKYYIEEMNKKHESEDDPKLNEEKLLEKGILLKNKYEEYQMGIIKDIQRRKKIESK